jgi:hypothetical protein
LAGQARANDRAFDRAIEATVLQPFRACDLQAGESSRSCSKPQRHPVRPRGNEHPFANGAIYLHERDLLVECLRKPREIVESVRGGRRRREREHH